MATEPSILFRLLLFTIGSIATAKTVNMAFRKIQQQLIRQHYRKCQPILTKLYKDINPFHISQQHREDNKIKSDEFIYGEIVYTSFSNILTVVKPLPNEIFYDLGCGAGKAVFTTALLYPDVIVRGVEMLKPLYELCLQLQTRLNELMNNNSYFQGKPLQVEFINGNLLNVDFSDANIVFLNATCFNKQNWGKICDKLEELQVGTRIIISSKYLESDNFDLIQARSYLMSWGLNTIHIYKKIK